MLLLFLINFVYGGWGKKTFSIFLKCEAETEKETTV